MNAKHFTVPAGHDLREDGAGQMMNPVLTFLTNCVWFIPGPEMRETQGPEEHNELVPREMSMALKCVQT